MAFEGAATLIFIFRILTLKASIISMALVASSRLDLLFFHQSFEDIVTFRYVMAVAVISLSHGVVQLPFAGYHAFKHKRFIPHRFEFYADKVMSGLLATGSGAGIAVSHLVISKGFGGDGGGGGGDDGDWIDDAVTNSVMDTIHNFWNKLLTASVFLFVAWICLVLISIVSYHNHDNGNNDTNPTLSTNPPPPPPPPPLPLPPPPRSNTIVLELSAKEQQTDENVEASSDDGGVYV